MEELKGVHGDLRVVREEIRLREDKQHRERTERASRAFVRILLEDHGYRDILNAIQKSKSFTTMTMEIYRYKTPNDVCIYWLCDLLQEEFSDLHFSPKKNKMGEPREIQVVVQTKCG